MNSRLAATVLATLSREALVSRFLRAVSSISFCSSLERSVELTMPLGKGGIPVGDGRLLGLELALAIVALLDVRLVRERTATGGVVAGHRADVAPIILRQPRLLRVVGGDVLGERRISFRLIAISRFDLGCLILQLRLLAEQIREIGLALARASVAELARAPAAPRLRARRP